MRQSVFAMCIFIFGCQANVSMSSNNTTEKLIGAKLTLQQNLVVPNNSANVIIISGKVEPSHSIDRFKSSCRFILDKIATTSRPISADIFTITRVRYDQDPITFGYSTSLSGEAFASYETIFSIHSDKQPSVRYLSCKHEDEQVHGRHLTLSEINATLGAIASIAAAKR